MKKRHGFVSNSSASAFMVIRSDKFYDVLSNEILLTPKEEALLIKFGFKKVQCCYSDQVVDELYTTPNPPTKAQLRMLKKMKIKSVSPKNNPNFNYGYDVSCNQDDVIYFLLKNNIPFEASVHYGHETVIYKRDAKEFLTIQNFGAQACMTNWKKSYKEVLECTDSIPAVTKTNVKKWLKQQKKWQENYDKMMEEEDAVLSILSKK